MLNRTHNRHAMTRAVNYAIYQIGWFACVLGAAFQWPWWGIAIAIPLIGLHLLLTTDRPNQARLLLVAGCVGCLVDTLLLTLGVFRFPSGSLVNWLPPVWMTVLWIQFATTFRYCLSWLSGRYVFCSVAAMIGAPMAFLGGERLGAVLILSPQITNLMILGSIWAIAVPLLIFLSDKIHANTSAASYHGFGNHRECLDWDGD